MKIGIMQPYLFPYIGYFQLIHAVDKFIVYDDVNFIKQGWINRNNILVQGRSFLFTIPLKNPSSSMKINEVLINDELYNKWKKKFFRTFHQSYKKAPYFDEVNFIVEKVFNEVPVVSGISGIAVKSILETCNYIGIDTEFEVTTEVYNNNNLSGQERVLDICKKEKATGYINPMGGLALYNKDDFKQQEIELNFIKSLPVEYEQFKNSFVPSLSIIDLMMFNSPENIRKMLNQYKLV